jgi:hypothetical protein
MSIILTSSVDSRDHLTLPNPKFGDSNTINFKRINRETRGNDLILRGESGWLPTELLRWEWEYLRDNEKILLKAFIARNVGLPVYTVDHYGVARTVVFLKPETEFSQVGVDNRTAALDMQIIT